MKVKIPPRKVFQYKKADYEGMKKKLRASLHEFQQKAESEDSEYLWTTFKKTTISLMESSSFPKCSEEINHRSHGYPRKSNVSEEKRKYSSRDSTRLEQLKTFINTEKPRPDFKRQRDNPTGGILRILLKSETQTRNISRSKSNSSTSSSHFGDNSSIAPLKEKGRLHDDLKDKADILNRQHESTWTKEDKDDIPIPDDTPFPSMGDIKVTE